jgi:protein arginine N-methyltransferase 5
MDTCEAANDNENHTARPRANMGGDLFFSPSLQHSLYECKNAGLDYCILPLVHPRAERSEYFSTKTRAERFGWPLTRSATLLTSSQWSTLLVGKLSSWMCFDNVDDQIIQESEVALNEEISWSSHLGLAALYVPQCLLSINFAQVLNLHLLQHSTPPIWIEIDYSDWSRWNLIRTICDY